ncbi:MAG: hypothetical protein JNM24_05000 [Bdellovibrionaceae bacterium]|nr:hypothetical protein [Pseudobdellovibrionaceae bacterium]
MKFISDLLLGIFKSVAIAIILSTLTLSLIQKKFPPSLTDARSLMETANKVLEMNASLKTNQTHIDEILDRENLITSRDNLLKEAERLDASNQLPVENSKLAKSITDTSKRDLAMLRIRLEQSEYKIRLLEYEMKQLKDEYRKLKR